MLWLYILSGILGAVLLLILLLLFVPVYARFRYDGEVFLRVRVLGIPVTLLPKKAEKATEKPIPKKKKAKPTKEKPEKEKKPGFLDELKASFREDGVAATLGYLTDLAKLAVSAVGKVLAAVTVDGLRLELLIAAEDAADAAENYGKVCAAAYPALEVLGQVLHIKKRQVRIEPGFLVEKSDAYTDVRLHVWVCKVLWAGLVFLVKMMLLKNTEELSDQTIERRTTK